MSFYFMKHQEREHRVFDDGRTKQSFADETDINKILAKYQVTGSISHLSKFKGTYGEFEEFDFHESQLRLAKGTEIFEALPSEVRREFDQDPGKFFAFVNNVDNKEDLERLLPGIAKPGDFFPDANPATEPGSLAGEGVLVADVAEVVTEVVEPAIVAPVDT